eukprot:scaffold526_cov356-Prasinococcus_capsulatus_cf.AAC.6
MPVRGHGWTFHRVFSPSKCIKTSAAVGATCGWTFRGCVGMDSTSVATHTSGLASPNGSTRTPSTLFATFATTAFSVDRGFSIGSARRFRRRLRPCYGRESKCCPLCQLARRRRLPSKGAFSPCHRQNPKQGVYLGHYTLDNDKLDCVVRYQGMSLAGGNRCLHAAHIPERKWHACLMPATTEQYATQVQTELKLRSTSRGANNRLDILSLVSGVQDSDDPRDQRRYNQGTTSYVFVPWSDIPNHCLNLPVSEMDFWIPG